MESFRRAAALAEQTFVGRELGLSTANGCCARSRR